MHFLSSRFTPHFRHGVLALGLVLLLVAAPVNHTVSAQTNSDTKVSKGDDFVIYQDISGEASCRLATLAEKRDLAKINPSNRGLRRITRLNQPDNKYPPGTEQQRADNVLPSHLTIILRATAQLDGFPDAKAAFIRAAQTWENQVLSPVTIYIDVDYGSTNFGQPWGANVLGSTSTSNIGAAYSSVRNSLAAGASNASETSIYAALPSTSLPTDLGAAASVFVPSSIARAIGLLDPTAQPADSAPRIGFNSNFSFDFDPSNGIDSGKIDFEAVATHEIGHALGFISSSGAGISTPAIWDFFRFRTGMTTSSFPTAQRIMTIGGPAGGAGQYYFVPGNTEVALSTGGPSASTSNNGDGNQSSHWKQMSLNGGVYIGIMDPRIPSGTRRQITANDTNALNIFGYSLENNNPPPPPPAAPANDNFVNAQSISGCTGTINGTTVIATRESGEPSHDPAGNAGGSSIWYQWTAPGSGSTTVTTAGSGFDTMLGVYTGTAVNSLTVIARNDDVQSGIITSTVTFSATAGTTYKIAIDGWGGDSGNTTLNWNLSNCPSTSLRIDGVSPPAGRPSGGQLINLTGEFANLSSVTIGGAAASWVYTNGGGNTSAITITTPVHAVGAVQIDLLPVSGSGYSKPNAFAYLPTVFTDDTLVAGATVVKAQHIIELRQAVDSLRLVAGLSAATWTDAVLVPTGTPIKAIHIQELRTNLNNVAAMLGYPTQPYTDPAIASGYVIKRVHVEELRQRIRTIAG